MTDTAKEQPVESVEDLVSSAIDAAEEVEDETVDETAEAEEPEISEPEAVEEESTEDSGDSDDEPPGDSDEPDGDDGDAIAAESDDEPEAELEAELEAPYHWPEADKETFAQQPREAQEYILRRSGEMEKHFTQKNQETSDIRRQYDSIRDSLAPYEQEFAKSGLDNAGAVRQLAHWHSSLKTDPNRAILELANMYGADLNAQEPDENIDPVLRQTQAQLNVVNQRLARQEQAAQQTQQNELYAKIQAFETQTDDKGQLLHPHFKALEETITGLFEAPDSIRPQSLDEAYNKALLLHPGLSAPRPSPEVVPKVNPAEKVKQAKKAATGVRSSGAVGKKERSKMTLEEEIASNFG